MDLRQFEDLTKGSFELDKEAMEACKLRWNEVAKPLYSLGTFEKHLIKIAGITGCQDINLDKKAIVVMCSDNGVVEEGVTQTDQSVTAIVAGHIAEGKGNINTLARFSGAQVIAVDIGMNTEETKTENPGKHEEKENPDKYAERNKSENPDKYAERNKPENPDKYAERNNPENPDKYAEKNKLENLDENAEEESENLDRDTEKEKLEEPDKDTEKVMTAKLDQEEETARQEIHRATLQKGFIYAKVASGTFNIAKGSAMSREQAIQAVMTGINLMKELKEKGYSLVGTGEMGIGNTTTSSAMASVLLKLPVKELTGPGAGLSKEGIIHKIQVIEQAIIVNKPDASDPLDVLAKIGGFDIAGITGLFLGGMLYRLPVVIDGIISAVAALTASRINPDAVHFMLASHQGREKACDYILKELGLTPVIYGDLALGEGSGTAFLFPLLDMAEAVYRNSPTFCGMKIAAYEDLQQK
ncbi:nicotinate-nucleotide--dimethylbenzimidazole phosphoribosyltransferase [Anaerocolumna sp. AGMB13020]|uniref:nicotinate-nucleotide--dimethylbenzimidazole phosphoribosyltransferase n=1 Tax=Anaerocolumna sp. AGMB13020 TaxID=3081750 RepID=UPI002953AACE|nr:nicotinate-nucleotide--dimethylbenzimidazole phosphoribosyltransferase [Anaerocolumna sp. AGMB13020]WOO38618.1 nicotinate-nucleotide--dimethylbenzimidazole phosphoribosyltransferase [Anaerocolumna sp. AGMB13020]